MKIKVVTITLHRVFTLSDNFIQILDSDNLQVEKKRDEFFYFNFRLFISLAYSKYKIKKYFNICYINIF